MFILIASYSDGFDYGRAFSNVIWTVDEDSALRNKFPGDYVIYNAM